MKNYKQLAVIRIFRYTGKKRPDDHAEYVIKKSDDLWNVSLASNKRTEIIKELSRWIKRW